MRRAGPWWLLLACACGRLEFDPVADGRAGNAACVAVPEVCNGIDDDCNQLVDEVCPCTPFEVTVPADDTVGTMVPLWLGDRYAVPVPRGGGYALQTILADGSVGPSVALPITMNPPIAWDGAHLFVATYVPGAELRLAKLALDGSIVDERVVTSVADRVFLQYVAGHLELAWEIFAQARFEAQRFDTRLQPLDSPHGIEGAGDTLTAFGFDGDTFVASSSASFTGSVRVEGELAPRIALANAADFRFTRVGAGFALGAVMKPGSSDRVVTAYWTPTDPAPTFMPVAVPMSFDPSWVFAGSRGDASVMMTTGLDSLVKQIYRFTVDASGRATDVRLIAMRMLPNMSLEREDSIYVDAQRAAMLWAFVPYPGAYPPTLVQSCF